MEWSVSEEKTKELLTEVMVDMLRNHRSLFREIVLEALEDAGMIHAIREGRKNDFVSEEEIMDLLAGGEGRKRVPLFPVGMTIPDIPRTSFKK